MTPNITYSMKLRIFLIVGILAVLFTACAQDERIESKTYAAMLDQLLEHSVPEISVQQLKDDTIGFLLLDAREKNEYAVSHLEEAISVGYDDFHIDSVSMDDRSAPIVVYCSVGYRSEQVAKQLIEAGYTTVYNLYGGIFEWKNQDGEVVDPESGDPTDEVHAFDRKWGVWLKEGTKIY